MTHYLYEHLAKAHGEEIGIGMKMKQLYLAFPGGVPV